MTHDDDLLECSRCGHQVTGERLRDDEYWRLTLCGRRHQPAYDCEPDEWVSVCPDCGARESFVLAEAAEDSYQR